MNILLKYFPYLTRDQQNQLAALKELYHFWNEQINVISRKDLDHLYERHVLHSLSIARFIQFPKASAILDVGTGGGFPGIPLAILFPDSEFLLVDSIGKKIKVVREVASNLSLKNVAAQQIRAENIQQKFHFVVSRAVTTMPRFYPWVSNKFKSDHPASLPNGIIALKGGDLNEELTGFLHIAEIIPLKNLFEEKFFESKKLVYIPAQ